MSRKGALRGSFVLVVDDKVHDREVLELVLSHFGAGVKTSDTAFGALKLLQVVDPDVVLIDTLAAAGKEDARWLLTRARERGVRAPFIVMSTDDCDEAALRREGFESYLPKPIDYQRLLDTIGGLVRRRERA